MLIKSVIDLRRANRNGEFPVKISISDKEKTKYISIGVYSKVDEFNEVTGLLVINKKDQKENAQKNILINTILYQLNDIVLELRKEFKAITIVNVMRKHKSLYSSERESLTFNSYFRKFISQKRGRTKEIYEITLKKIEKYFPSELYFEDIDNVFLKSFVHNLSKEIIKHKDSVKIGLSVNALTLCHCVISNLYGISPLVFKRISFIPPCLSPEIIEPCPCVIRIHQSIIVFTKQTVPMPDSVNILPLFREKLRCDIRICFFHTFYFGCEKTKSNYYFKLLK